MTLFDCLPIVFESSARIPPVTAIDFQLSTDHDRRCRLFLLFGLFLFASGRTGRYAVSQTVGTSAPRSEDAVTFLQNSLHAMNDNGISTNDLQCTAQETLSIPTQSAQTTQSQWKDMLHQTLMPSSVEMQQSSGGDATSENIVMLRVRRSNANLQKWMIYPQYALSRLLLDTSYSLSIQKMKDGTATLTAIKTVRGMSITVTKQIWYFSSSSPLPTKVSYSLPNPRNRSFSIQRSIDYGEFKQFDGIMSPQQYVVHTVANPDWQGTISSLQCVPSTSLSN